jgi:hypothetical protein
MAKQKHSQQTWWQLGAVVLIMVGLLILAHQVAPSPGWRIFLEMGVVVAGYGLIILWLDAHSTALLDRQSAESDSHAIELLEREMPAPQSSHVQIHFYVYSDPAIVYNMPESPASRQSPNGHHPAKTIPSLPEEAAE